jgi:hypothetical protein
MKQDMNVNRLTSIILILLFSILSCQKEDLTPPENYESVFLRDLTGLGGCTLVLQKRDNEYLEPTNLDEFDVQFEVGKEYWIIYENPSSGSYCMVGDVVQLLDIRTPFKN